MLSMDQNISSELPPVKVPEQQAEPVYSQFEVPAGPAETEVQSSARIERGQSAPAAPLQQSPVIPQLGQVAAQPSKATPSDPAAAGLPTIADDADLIEKEWVVKAKEIVARTSHDPYQQNKQVEHLKADYLKKRYNKDVKITED